MREVPLYPLRSRAATLSARGPPQDADPEQRPALRQRSQHLPAEGSTGVPRSSETAPP
ncbi:hypothetical protein T484DRAFT_3443150 [Baffinella frigidus]|nr:hypothetical protein T484DRAFT_3443150 [Cryptophyta sp. CCMP2293]